MALYKYTKKPIELKEYSYFEETIIVEDDHTSNKRRITLGDIIFGSIADFKQLLIQSRIAGIMIPILFIGLGVFLIYRQTWPEFEQYVKYSLGYYDIYSVPLVAGDYVDRANYLSDPGADYFRVLAAEAKSVDTLEPDPMSNNFKGTFKISIPSLGLNNLPVTANVESGVKEAYDAVLVNSLAHFKDTGLPISSVNNNIVIYGHSSTGDYWQRTRDIAGAFSMLNQIKVGDEITITMEGKEYKYRVSRSKIVQPNDISIVTGTPGERTLTLFTCFPNGNNAKRFVAVAKPIN
jgi:LPXTG-site transpeptidase (sortase) family protein